MFLAEACELLEQFQQGILVLREETWERGGQE